MASPRGDSLKTKAQILDAAKRLFAERGIAVVSVRDIAAAAGVSHGLVQRYFGNRNEMVAAIIKSEIDDFTANRGGLEPGVSASALEALHGQLASGLVRFSDYARVIMRAELAGVEPEQMLDPDAPTPARQLADGIAAIQGRDSAEAGSAPDPRMVSAFINAALFGFATLSPWLMTSVGLDPEDYPSKANEIADLAVALVLATAGDQGNRKGQRT